MKAHSAFPIAIIALSMMVAGCAQDGTLFSGNLNTSSIDQTAAAQTPKSNPLCLTLASQIEALNKDGVGEKVSKAAVKKYKMKTGDLAKADELNKANSEFQAKCSEYPPNPTVATLPAPEPTPVATKVASKAKPPVPSPKPVAAAVAPQASQTMQTSQSSETIAQSPTQP